MIRTLRGGVPLVLLCAACASTPLGKVDPGTLPAQAAYPEHGAIVVFHHQTVQFALGDDGEPVSISTVRRRVKLLAESGRHEARVVAHYSKAFSDVRDFVVQVTHPDGEVVVTRQEDASDVPSAPGFVLYSDTRVLTVSNQHVPTGSVIDSSYTIVRRDALYWALAHQHAEDVPVLDSRFEVSAPAGWTLETRHRLGNEEAPDAHTADGQTIVYAAQDVEALPRWAHAPPAWRLRPLFLVRLASYVDGSGERHQLFTDFPSLSRFYAELEAPQLIVSDDIRDKAREVLRGAPPTKSDRARLLYNWVRDHITYCAIHLGIGGWQPHKSSETFDVGYGDCKDKANLLRSLLAADGIDSHMASIHNHRGYPKDSVLPVLGANYNHAILVVETEQGRIVADPTTRLVPFGQLPFGDQGAHLLVGTKGGEDLVRTPLSEPFDNRGVYTANATVHDDGTISEQIAFEAWGETARRIRANFLIHTASEQKEAVAALFDLDREHVQGVEVQGAAPPATISPVSGTVKLHDKTPRVVKAGPAQLVTLGEIVPTSLPDVRNRQRTAPVLLGPPRHLRVVTTLVPPVGWQVQSLPPAFTRETDDVVVALRFSQEGQTVKVARDLLVKSPWVEVARVPDYVRLVTDLHEKERAAIVLAPTP